jgi:hypothetical protein
MRTFIRVLVVTLCAFPVISCSRWSGQQGAGAVLPSTTRPLVLSESDVVALLGKPDAVVIRGQDKIEDFIAGDKVLLYYRTRSATLHLALGFSRNALVDAAYVDFGNKRGLACDRIELNALPPVYAAN